MSTCLKSISAVVVLCLLIMGGCLSPAAPVPSTINVVEEIHFGWLPPGGGQSYEVSISAGRYRRSFEAEDQVFYISENGLVAKTLIGQPAEKTKGGIGYSKKRGDYFIWKVAPSFISDAPLNGILDTFRDGPSIQIYLGRLPAKLEKSLMIER